MKIKQLFNLNNKYVVIIGCNKGLGKNIALNLLKLGCTIIGINQLNLIKHHQIQSLTKKFININIDFKDINQINNINNIITKHIYHHEINILINNYELNYNMPLLTKFNHQVNPLNHLSYNYFFKIIQIFAKIFANQGTGGKIININSCLTFKTIENKFNFYHPIIKLTKLLGYKWAKFSINFNTIIYGLINSDSLIKNPIKEQKLFNKIPSMKWGSYDDIIGSIIFFGSNASNYIHGQILTVDGGYLLH